MLKSIYILITALFIGAVFFAQSAFAQTDVIELVYAKDVVNSVKYENTTVAKGNVEFKHNGTRLFCDSALYFRNQNLVHAYGKVQINQGDTVNLFCDSLKFNGNTNISKLISNVRFRDNEYLLLTDSLEYNGNKSFGYYKRWATISSINSDLKLTSKKGYYYSDTKTFFFKDSVHVEDPKYELFSDTLEFRTLSTSAHFHGPTVIQFDSSEVHCVKGEYRSNQETINLWNGASILEPGRSFYADSIFYNQAADLGEGFCNVRLYDSTENVLFLSDYLLKKEKNHALILKDNAHVVQFTEKDTLYLSSDTISYYMDTISEMKLTILENNVAILNGDMRIRCDSAYFSEVDSILKLHKEPILWSQNTQLFADSVLTTYFDNTFHEMFMHNNAMIISEHEADSIHFDQVKGRYMKATLDSNKIKQVYIESNAQTLYYVEETKKDTMDLETKTLTGMNKIDCNEIFIRFINSEISTVSFLDQPTSIFYPIDKIPNKELYLKGFLWQIERKPPLLLLE